jgi:hypothetical protein
MADRFGYALAVIALLGLAQPSQAVEGGMGAYLPGSRDSFAGIVPAPGFYAGVDLVFSEGSVDGLSLAGLPIRADADIDLIFTKLSLTQVFDGQIWGGTPAVNINIPFVLDANLSYTAVTAPVAGVGFEDSTSGIGDITVTPMVGWHRGNLHYSAGFSIFAPTGSYKAANLSLRNREVDVLNTGKNIWSFQPVLAATHMDPATGLEFSGAASVLFSTENKTTDYQNAPAINLEAAVLQHTKSGWAFGVSGYGYGQTGDDSGKGAKNSRDFLKADSLRAQVFGAGPIITYSGGKLFGAQTSFKFKYYTEFNAERRFESDTVWLNMSLAF